MNRIQYEISDILNEIEGSPDQVGYDLSLTQIYDNIRNAKFEEDDSISMGIWERDLKKANWVEVEKLCVEALREKTKDLQIVVWLIEALAVLDGFEGILKGMDILNSFIKKFWQICYPRNEDNSSDIDQKYNILEWIFDTISKRSKFISFVPYSAADSVNLYDYEYTIEIRNLTIRSPDSSSEIIESAKKVGKRSLDEIINIIKSKTKGDFKSILEDFKNIKVLKTILDQTLVEVSNEEYNSFSDLILNIDKIEKIILSNVEPESQTIQSNSPQTISPLADSKSRDEIYDKISNLSKQLSVIEKHSPSSFILDLVVSWRDKSLLQIMDDLKEGSSDAHKLLRILMG